MSAASTRVRGLLGLVGLFLGLSMAAGCGGAMHQEAQIKVPAERDTARRDVAEHRAHIESLLAGSTTIVTSDSETSGATGSCTDTCRVAEDLCASTNAICQIADQHAHDQEIRATCAWAEDECEQARSRCQACGGRGR